MDSRSVLRAVALLTAALLAAMAGCASQTTSEPATTDTDGQTAGSPSEPAADELDNTFGEDRYGGPAPPPGSGDHAYVVTVYALDTPTVTMPEQPSATDIAAAVEGHVLASANITGVFGR